MKITQPCAFIVKNQEELDTLMKLITDDNVWSFLPKEPSYQSYANLLEEIEDIKPEIVYIFIEDFGGEDWQLYFGSERDFKNDDLPLVEWRTL